MHWTHVDKLKATTEHGRLTLVVEWSVKRNGFYCWLEFPSCGYNAVSVVWNAFKAYKTMKSGKAGCEKLARAYVEELAACGFVTREEENAC
jgi:hypothetical protein